MISRSEAFSCERLSPKQDNHPYSLSRSFRSLGMYVDKQLLLHNVQSSNQNNALLRELREGRFRYACLTQPTFVYRMFCKCLCCVLYYVSKRETYLKKKGSKKKGKQRGMKAQRSSNKFFFTFPAHGDNTNLLQG